MCIVLSCAGLGRVHCSMPPLHFIRAETHARLQRPCLRSHCHFAEEGSNSWKKVAEVPSSETSFKATGLVTGKKHKFRVKSANEEGESEALESDYVTPVQPDQPPKIDQKVGCCDDRSYQFLS